MGSSEQYCTFRLENIQLGLPVSLVQEVIRHQDVTRVPLARGNVSGLMNLRGQIVTAIDLRHRFGIEDPFPRPPMSLIVAWHDEATALLVDEIGDVVIIDSDETQPVPDTLVPPVRELITKVVRVHGGLLLLLDLGAAIATTVPI
ncbi:MAG: chemotaxis protein CheW [Ferrimicrobium sp.]